MAHPKRTGRTTLLTDAAQENIVRALRAGVGLKHAVEGFGIAYATAARWMADGQAHADGTATTAQRQTLGSAAEQHAAPACTGLDERGPSGEVVRVCSTSALHDFREFRAAVVRARAEAVVTVVGRLQEAAREGSVTAQLALLRAMAPEVYRPEAGGERPGPAAPGASGGPATSWRVNGQQQHATTWRAARGGRESDSSAPTVPASKRSVNANRRDIRQWVATEPELPPGTAPEPRSRPQSREPKPGATVVLRPPVPRP